MSNGKNVALVVGIVVFALLAGGLAMTTWAFLQRARAEQEAHHAARVEALYAREQAERSRAQAEATSAFIQQMLERSAPPAGDAELTVREVLDAAAASLDERFADRPLVAGRLHLTIGQAYLRAGEHARAETSLLAAHRLLSSEREADDTDVVATVRSLVELYDTWSRIDPAADPDGRAAEWRSKLPLDKSNGG